MPSNINLIIKTRYINLQTTYPNFELQARNPSLSEKVVYFLAQSLIAERGEVGEGLKLLLPKWGPHLVFCFFKFFTHNFV